MKKVVFLALFFLIMIMPMVFALQINIKTSPAHRISVIIRNAGELPSLDSFHKDTGDGNVVISSPDSTPEIDILVILKKDGIKLLEKKFDKVSAVKAVNINLIPGGEIGVVESFEKKVNETNVSEDNVTEIINETESLPEESVAEKKIEKEPGVTGKTVENIKSILTSKTTYYIIGGIIIIVVLFFVIRFARKKFESKKSFKVTKLSSLSSGDSKRLEDAERKLESAKEELDEIKNRKKKLQEAKERFKKDQRELEKLERGY